MPAWVLSSPRCWSSPGWGKGIGTASKLGAATVSAELSYAERHLDCRSAVQVSMPCQRRRACTVISPLYTAKANRTPTGRMLTCCHIVGAERPALGDISCVPQGLCLGRQGLGHAALLLNKSALALGSLSAVGPAGQ